MEQRGERGTLHHEHAVPVHTQVCMHSAALAQIEDGRFRSACEVRALLNPVLAEQSVCNEVCR